MIYSHKDSGAERPFEQCLLSIDSGRELVAGFVLREDAQACRWKNLRTCCRKIQAALTRP